MVAIVFWFIVYRQLLPFAQALVALLPIEPDGHLA